MGKIKRLSDEIINQIAAGEIVERPASALKEIVENAIDANAKNIEVFLRNGGKSKIIVMDDGGGLDKEDLKMSVQRHTTSKLKGDNLFDIRSYGFRGEAIASIASVSDFMIESNGYGVSVHFSEKSGLRPSEVDIGTRITVENLFMKLPARLKFLKSDNVELSSCLSVIEDFSLINSNIKFSVATNEKPTVIFNGDSLEDRVANIFGQNVIERGISFREECDSISISGYLFHPMDSKYSQSFQKVFVNGRVVRDKIVSASLRNAYKNLIPTGRFAIAVLFIEIDPFHVDVNVSPTKSEIRFRDTSYVQKFLTEAIRKNLLKFDRVMPVFELSRSTETNAINNPAKIATPITKIVNIDDYKQSDLVKDLPVIAHDEEMDAVVLEGKPTCATEALIATTQVISEAVNDDPGFFGKPVAQVFDSYIITETQNGIIIIDQHAVHEKITQEKMLNSITLNNKQFLVKPEILEISQKISFEIDTVLDNLKECGFSLDVVQNSVIVSAIPSVLNSEDAVRFVRDVFENQGDIDEFKTIDLVRHKIAEAACHNSIRFGRKLSHAEMTAIIDQMEQTETIHQCNHHRPSFVEITKTELKKLFDR